MIEIEGIAGKLALLAPIAVLAIVVWRTSRWPATSGPGERRMLKRTMDSPLGVMSPSTLDALEAKATEVAEQAVTVEPAVTAAPEPAHPDLEPAPPAEVKATAAIQAPPPRPSPVDWPTLIAEAAEKGDNAALAAAYLAYAKAEIADGRPAPAGDHLRSCLQFAARTRDRALQAEARLELAELARATGDLTTACEHWQIARALFHELASKRELDETERLMRSHGCPTDWVLNDF
ncbi:hypothetical protein [Hyphomicrobium sp.]|uniref:hypothetical protein n=1 Tax=Hyphomicrobium sp. TaxID=82 RepID=UPI003F7157BD